MRKDIFAAFGGYAKWEEDWQSLAKAVYNAGYRKADEFAREIFEEIEALRLKHAYGEIDEADLNIGLYELKKKYTGEI